MSYTNIEQVKKHVTFADTPSGTVRDHLVIFSDTGWVSLPGIAIASGSVTVKAIKNAEPAFEALLLGDEPVLLAHRLIASGSLTVASDTSLGTIYNENADYIIDIPNGAIVRLSEGSIAGGSVMAVWYYYYSTYSEGTDYSVDYAEGRIRRLAAGNIRSGQAVFVDYELSSTQMSDSIVKGAVAEANAIIEKEIDPEKTFGADPTLQTAATYLAVSLVCRIAAADRMIAGSVTKSSASAGAGEWLALAESYRSDYQSLLKTFRPQAARMNHPKLS